MAFDAFTVRCLVDELQVLINGRIDKIHQPERDEIVLNIRTMTDSYKLVLSASSAHPRVHFTKYSKKNPITAPMFCMLLRKHIGSGKIVAIEQDGFERIINISIESYDELGDLTMKHVIVEIMGRHSNIILTNSEMKIIDSIKHVDFTVSSVRQILPGLEYVSPPSQEKTDFIDADIDLELNFDVPARVDKVIMSSLAGISSIFARELVYKTFARTDVEAGELNLNKQSALKANILKAAADIKFAPCIIFDNASGKALDFCVMDIKQYGDAADVKHFDSLNEVLDSFYNTRDMHERMRQKSADLVKTLTNNIERVTKKLNILHRTLSDAENKDKYRIYGDLLTANIYKIKEGQKSIEAENYYDGSIVNISLDERLSPSQNAQRYYKKYNKAKTAEIEAAKQIESAKNDLEYLESTMAAVENAETESDLNAIRAELINEGYINRRSPKKQKPSQSKPMHFISEDGFDIYVGKNNTQNDYLTLRFANSSDLWFHTKNIHGSHVVIKLGIDKEVPKNVVKEAAQLAAYYSKARESSQVPVDYTRIKNVKKPSGAKPGMVIYEGYNTIYVTPKKPENN